MTAPTCVVILIAAVLVTATIVDWARHLPWLTALKRQGELGY